MTTREKFLSEYEIVRMNKNSITLRSYGKFVYVHRNVFNEIMNGNAVDYKEEETQFQDGQIQLWIKTLIWKFM
jgi:flagellar basal body rod protein FlgB